MLEKFSKLFHENFSNKNVVVKVSNRLYAQDFIRKPFQESFSD